jgi:hypothetical protein
MTYFRKSYKRWLAWLLLATIFAIACGFLSDWQFHRRAERVAQISIVQSNYNAKPVLAKTLFGSKLAKNSMLWRPVVLYGRFLNDKAMLVRNRPQNGQPGFEQVIPFDSTVGTFLIDRGWLPTGNLQDAPDRNPLPGESSVRIVVRLMRSEPSLNRDAPAGQLAEIDLKNVAAKMAVPINLDWYGQLVSNNTSKLPLQLTEPSTDEGNHLSYAIQWIMFAIMAFGFLGWVIRKEFEFARSQNDPNYVAPKQRNSQARLDAQAEDAED